MWKVRGRKSCEAEILFPIGEAGLGEEDGFDFGVEADDGDFSAPREEQGATDDRARFGVGDCRAESPCEGEDERAKRARKD